MLLAFDAVMYLTRKDNAQGSQTILHANSDIIPRIGFLNFRQSWLHSRVFYAQWFPKRWKLLAWLGWVKRIPPYREVLERLTAQMGLYMEEGKTVAFLQGN